MDYKSSYREEEVVAETILDRTIKFVDSSRFVNAVDKFKGKNVHYFESYAESKSAEYDLRHTAVFEEYQTLLDDLFAEFSSDIGVSSKEIYQNCRDVGKCAPFPYSVFVHV